MNQASHHHLFRRESRIVVATVAIVAAITAAVHAGDWATYKHDLHRTSISDETLVFPMRAAWEFIAPQKPSPAWAEPYGLLNRTDFDYAPAPVIAAGIVCFASTSDDTVRALDANNGQEKWRFVTGGPVRVAPQIVPATSPATGGKVYFGSDDGFVYCIDATTGKLAWKFRGGPVDERLAANHRMISRWPVRTGALVADGVVYGVAGLINMEGVFAFALNAETGKLIWRNDTLGFLSVGIVDFPDDGDPRSQAVGGHNGEFAANGAIGANPEGALLLHGNNLIVPNGNSNSTALDRRTGIPTGAGGGSGGTWLTIDKDILYSYGRHHEDVQSIRPVSLVGAAVGRGWGQGPVPQVRMLPPRKDGRIHAKGKVSSIIRNGKLYSRHAYGIAMSGNTLILGAENAIVAQDPDTERVLWRAPVKGEPREIAIADGRIYVGTDTGAIYCFESAPRGTEKPVVVINPTPALPAAPTPSDAITKIIEQLKRAGMDRGFTLVLGDADGKVSMSLAARTNARIIMALTDEVAVDAMRERLIKETAWNGSRISVQHVSKLDRLPFAQFFANAVIVAGPVPGLAARELYRVLRPCGGLLLAPGLKPDEANTLMGAAGALDKEMRQSAEGAFIARGKLPGAFDWDSTVRIDQRVKWPLRPLWIGGPTTEQIHPAGGVGDGPIIANGRYFVQGEQSMTAVDAYNGEILWTRSTPKTSPERMTLDGVVYTVAEPAGFARDELARSIQADNDYVYLLLGSAYFQTVGDDISNELGKAVTLKSRGEGRIQLDARTGEQIKLVAPFNPSTTVSLKSPQKWTLTIDARRNGVVNMEATDKGVQLTLTTADTLVTSLDAWDLYFDFRAPDARYGLYERGAFTIHVTPSRDKETPAAWTPGTGAVVPNFEVTGTRDAVGTSAVVLLTWAEIEKLTGAKPASFGFGISLDSHSGGKDEPIVRRHLFCDWAADGLNNGWACVVLDGARPDVNKKPAVLIDAFPKIRVGQLSGGRDDVTPAREAPRVHPLTGDLVPKMFRLGGCGGVSSAAGLRSGSQSIYDFDDDSGMRPLGGIKARCSTPQTIALGLIIYSEEAGHCECPYPIRGTLVMAPAERRLNEDWAFYFDRPADTYLRQAAVNFGAPGDRRDDAGTLWLGFPRIPGDRSKAFPVPAAGGRSVGANGVWLRTLSASLQLPVEVECVGGVDGYKPQEDVVAPQKWFGNWSPGRLKKAYGPYHLNADQTPIAGTDRPWIYTSGIRGINKASVKLNFLQPMASIKTEKEPTINVKLDGTEWKGEPTAKLPFTGTEIFLRHDDVNLYVVARRLSVIDRLGKPVQWAKRTSGEDAIIWDDDSFEVFLSSGAGGSGKTGKVAHFGVSASGARFDALADGAENRPEDRAWNGTWKSGVAADETGLVIALTIPWKTLEAAGLPKERLSANFQMNQKDVSGEPVTAPGSMQGPKGTATSGEALSYLGMSGRTHCENFAPIGVGALPPPEPRYYTVRLHFAELDDVKAGQRVFDVKIQDQTLLKDFDIVKEVGGKVALVKEFGHIPASDVMKLEFTAASKEVTPTSVPIISAMEVVDEAYVSPTQALKEKNAVKQ